VVLVVVVAAVVVMVVMADMESKFKLRYLPRRTTYTMVVSYTSTSSSDLVMYEWFFKCKTLSATATTCSVLSRKDATSSAI
jgi:hypothetical protein